MCRVGDAKDGGGTGPGAADECLLAAVARGDHAAFAQLYRRLQPPLQRFARRALRDGEAVDDVVAETLLVIWRTAARFRGGSRVTTWAFGIAWRQAMHARRSARPAPIRIDGDAPSEDDPQADRLDRGIRRRALRQALATLPVEQRRALELCGLEGRSCEAVAALQDCPVGTVKSRLFHARLKLKPLLEDLRG